MKWLNYAPVQGEDGIPGGTIPWAVHELVWKEYNRVHPNLQSASRIAERSGFSWSEVIAGLRGDMSTKGLLAASRELAEVNKQNDTP